MKSNQLHYATFIEEGQLLFYANEIEASIPEDDEIFVLKKI